VVAGWPGSVHDMRVFDGALLKYGNIFPHPPHGKFKYCIINLQIFHCYFLMFLLM
jgi:hypothetical protein